jgi:hypothetical protein
MVHTTTGYLVEGKLGFDLQFTASKPGATMEYKFGFDLQFTASKPGVTMEYKFGFDFWLTRSQPGALLTGALTLYRREKLRHPGRWLEYLE